MLDIAYIRDNPEEIRESISRRGMKIDLDKLLELDQQRRQHISRLDELRAERNQISEQVPKAVPDKRQELIARVKTIKEELATLETAFGEIESSYMALLMEVPNRLSKDVPSGKSDADNVELRRWGMPPQFDFPAKDHVEIGESQDLIDFERAAKVAGSKFYFLKNELVLLELALKQFALEELIKAGYSPIKAPVLARQDVLQGTGYNPRGEETQIYTIENSDLGMIATSEIPIAGLLTDDIVESSDLPLKFAGISECYRTEAGNYGRFSKGLYRVHHFDKVEMFVFCRPEDSAKYHQEILGTEEKIFQALEIPYRVVDICDGDMGSVAWRKYDLEAWMPGRGESGDYGEVTSCSNCTDYQSRRLNIRYRTADDKVAFLHTLNGTALATSSRTMIALLENYQLADGRIQVPKVLQPFLQGRTHIGKK